MTRTCFSDYSVGIWITKRNLHGNQIRRKLLCVEWPLSLSWYIWPDRNDRGQYLFCIIEPSYKAWDDELCTAWTVMLKPSILGSWKPMITSLNGNVFRVTVPLWGDRPVTTSQRPATRSFDVFFGVRLNKRLPVIWDAMMSMWRHCNDICIVASYAFVCFFRSGTAAQWVALSKNNGSYSWSIFTL